MKLSSLGACTTVAKGVPVVTAAVAVGVYARGYVVVSCRTGIVGSASDARPGVVWIAAIGTACASCGLTVAAAAVAMTTATEITARLAASCVTFT